jgi:ABC-type sugar transport system ATPase subunit
MAQLKLHQLSKQFEQNGQPVNVLKRIDLTVTPGEFLVLVGPSGCGKSTILRLVSGLESPTSGDIFIDDRCVNTVSPKDRDVAMVFQNYALYPHMTVYDNLAFGLKMRKTPHAIIEQKVMAMATLLQLEPLLKRKPKQLSGGQRQRVALGRAMIRSPKLYLMDEPLSNLDAQLRSHTRGEIMRLHQQFATTTVYVTHDQTEAMTMGNRMAVLNQGELQQVGKPLAVYQQPVNRFVAGFLGQIRWAKATPSSTDTHQWHLLGQPITLPVFTDPDNAPTATNALAELWAGLRPEYFSPTQVNANAINVPVVPNRFELLGHEKWVYFTVEGTELLAEVPPDWQGSDLWLDITQVKWFNPLTDLRLFAQSDPALELNLTANTETESTGHAKL